MSETFLYMLTVISLAVSTSALYLALSMAKSVKIAHMQLQQLFEVLFQVPPGGDYYIQFEDEPGNPDEIPAPHTSKDKVINMFSKRPMKYDETLEMWVEDD